MSTNKINQIKLPNESEPYDLSVKLKNVQSDYTEGGWPVRDRMVIDCGNATPDSQVEPPHNINFTGRIKNGIDTSQNWTTDGNRWIKKGEIVTITNINNNYYDWTNGTALFVAKEDNTQVCPVVYSPYGATIPDMNGVIQIAKKTAKDVIDDNFNHNGIYRGKDLTIEYTPAQIKSLISQGPFTDLYLGDYFDLVLSDNKRCRLEVAHFNYYKDRGINDPHVVFIVGYTSDGYAGASTGTNGTAAGITTGYYNSTIHTTTLPAWVTKIENALGYSLTSFNERLSSAINTSINSMIRQPNGSSMPGCVSAMTWDTSKALLPNSMQVYGESICSNTAAETGLSNQKFALFNFEPFWYNNPISDVTGASTDASTAIWLRDIYGDGYLLSDTLGRPGRRHVDAGAMLRPYIIIS